jgi:hypothetical protein
MLKRWCVTSHLNGRRRFNCTLTCIINKLVTKSNIGLNFNFSALYVRKPHSDFLFIHMIVLYICFLLAAGKWTTKTENIGFYVVHKIYNSTIDRIEACFLFFVLEQCTINEFQMTAIVWWVSFLATWRSSSTFKCMGSVRRFSGSTEINWPRSRKSINFEPNNLSIIMWRWRKHKFPSDKVFFLIFFYFSLVFNCIANKWMLWRLKTQTKRLRWTKELINNQ